MSVAQCCQLFRKITAQTKEKIKEIMNDKFKTEAGTLHNDYFAIVFIFKSFTSNSF